MATKIKSIESKKKQQQVSSSPKPDAAASMLKVTEFLGDVKAEFKKITWTSKEELLLYTKVVVLTTFIFGMGIYCIDLMIQGCLNGLNTIVKLMS